MVGESLNDKKELPMKRQKLKMQNRILIERGTESKKLFCYTAEKGDMCSFAARGKEEAVFWTCLSFWACGECWSQPLLQVVLG